MSNTLPKTWTTSICYNCKFFHAYPIRKEHGEDWQWECHHSKDYGEYLSEPLTNCQGFQSK